MRRLTSLIPILFLLLTGVAHPVLAFKRIHVGESVGDFSFHALGQKAGSLSAVSGKKATVLLLWATWSPRSIEALLDFQELYAEHGPENLQVVALNVDKQDPDAETRREVETTVSDLGLTYPVAMDDGLLLFERFGVVVVPSVVLIDPGQTVVALLDGYAHTSRPAFRQKVFQVLGLKSPTAGMPADRTAAYTPKGKSLRYYRMGNILWRQGRRAKAIKALARSVAEDPDHIEACRALAEALRGAGRIEEAERIHLQLAKLQDFCIVERRRATTTP